ncbi:MAG TPA: Trm112 family protein [Kofleriaceae bacterium]|nr:Trm112 family protein [Kofleriaceae bacterium]
MLATSLLEVLVCPKSKQPLIYFADEGFLLCPASRLRYRIDDGVPVLLVEEATELSSGEVDRLVAQAKVRGLTGA